MSAATDWLGNTYAVGEPVLYCISAGRGQLMATGVVQAIRRTTRTRRQGRPATPGETPTRILDWHTPPMGWIEEDISYDDVEVQVLTHRTSGSWDNGKRTRPAWVNPLNITALGGLQDAVTQRVTPGQGAG